MKGWIMFAEIQNYKVMGLKKSQISKQLKIDYKTVCKYWNMTTSEFEQLYTGAKSRNKKIDCFKPQILEWLFEFPDSSTAQIFDWLLERHKQLDFKERTLRLYVQQLREIHKISKITSVRQYEEVPESPLGYQAQADFGQTWVRKTDGKMIKVYCFALVLSNSRYKFVWWQTKHFTTNDLIYLHNKAFAYFGGMPKEIVYDQDRIIVVSENAGDIICTEGFQNYIHQMKFKMRLCKAYDPESKGKVEAVVKFAKNNFARNRRFIDIESFNDECMLWLDRTGNGKVHDITKKVPKEVFALEKQHLIQIPFPLINQSSTLSLTYSVRKNNTISYKQNRYQVPKGTYSPGKEILLILKDNTLDIVDQDTEEVIVSHKVKEGKGHLVPIYHPERSIGTKTQALYDKVLQAMNNTETAVIFLDKIKEDKPRYFKDQLSLIDKACLSFSNEMIAKAITYCLERNLIGGSLFKETLTYLSENKAIAQSKSPILASYSKSYSYVYVQPEVRSIEEYMEKFRKDKKQWVH